MTRKKQTSVYMSLVNLVNLKDAVHLASASASGVEELSRGMLVLADGIHAATSKEVPASERGVRKGSLRFGRYFDLSNPSNRPHISVYIFSIISALYIYTHCYRVVDTYLYGHILMSGKFGQFLKSHIMSFFIC